MKAMATWVAPSLALILLCPSSAPAQAPRADSTITVPRFELAPIGGGSAFFRHSVSADALWGIKAGGFGGRHGMFGFEGSLEQSIRRPDFLFVGGDFVAQFTSNDPKKVVPFLHAGAGAFVLEGDPTPGLSFGGGIKAPLGRRIAVRIGLQDRIRLRDSLHRFDVYGGITFRF